MSSMLRSLLFLITLSVAIVTAPPTSAAETPKALDFGGRWYSHFGYLVLSQADQQVQGTYSCCGGEITGVIKGELLEFFWKDPIYGEGWGHFYLREEGQMLVGGWGTAEDMGLSGPWNAVRFDDSEPAGLPKRFRVEMEHPDLGELEATAALSFSEDQVTGILQGVYHLTAQGKPFRQEVFQLLAGRSEPGEVILEWRDPIDGVRGKMTLNWAEGQGLLEGRVQVEGGSEQTVPISFIRLEAREELDPKASGLLAGAIERPGAE